MDEVLRIDEAVAKVLPGAWAVASVVERTGPVSRAALPDPRRMVPPGLTPENLKDEEVVKGFRKVSWSLGIDPTKLRPSGEALARRILGGNPPPAIHPLVDAYNLASAATLVPLSAYDLDHTSLPLTIRLSRAGESFHGIARDPETLEDGRVVYAAADDVIAGVMMWRDGNATKVRDGTRRALILAVGAEPVTKYDGLNALGVAEQYAAKVGFTKAAGPYEAAGR